MFVSRLQKKNLDNIVTFQFITWHTFDLGLFFCVLYERNIVCAFSVWQ